MARVLLTVSGVVAPDTAAQAALGVCPRADYLELARAFGADLIDYTQATASRAGRVIARAAGPAPALAWACFARRAHYDTIVTDGEQVGIPLAALLKYSGAGRPRHVMIAHLMSARKKMLCLDLFGVQSQIDRMLVYSTWQQRFITSRWGLPPERVAFTPFTVDGRFFAPGAVTPQPAAEPLICAAGLERRDYPTLLAAVRGLDTRVTIAAASPWARQPDTTCGRELPSNVTVRRFTQYELRQLYADSRFVVVPLYNVDFQAGVTTILEAMAMGRAVICSRTPGQTDIVVEGATGLYVPPGDARALRAAIVYLLANPAEARRMGAAGRRRVEQELDLDCYVARLSRLVEAEQGSGVGG